MIHLRQLTERCHNLRFQTKLGLETVGKVGNSTMAITGNIGNVANMVEHVSTCEEQDGDQADGSPNVSVLNDWQHIRRSSHQDSSCAEDNGNG